MSLIVNLNDGYGGLYRDQQKIPSVSSGKKDEKQQEAPNIGQVERFQKGITYNGKFILGEFDCEEFVKIAQPMIIIPLLTGTLEDLQDQMEAIGVTIEKLVICRQYFEYRKDNIECLDEPIAKDWEQSAFMLRQIQKVISELTQKKQSLYMKSLHIRLNIESGLG